MDEKKCEDEEPPADDWEDEEFFSLFEDPFVLFDEWSSPADIAAFDSLVEKP